MWDFFWAAQAARLTKRAGADRFAGSISFFHSLFFYLQKFPRRTFTAAIILFSKAPDFIRVSLSPAEVGFIRLRAIQSAELR